MKKTIKITVILLLFLIVFPALAGVAVMLLWNSILTDVCGFAAVTFWQGTGLFVLGQILAGGFLLALFFIGGGIHALGHGHGEWRRHWHDMTAEQRREFVSRRRREHLGFMNGKNDSRNAAE